MSQLPPSRVKSPGPRAGLAAIREGVRFLFRNPASWPHAVVPAAVLVTLQVAMTGLAVFWLRPWVQAQLANPASWLGSWGSWIAGWLAAALASAVGLVLAVVLTPPLSSPALEKIVALVESQAEVPPRKPIGVLAEMACGVRAQVFAALFLAPILVLLGLLDLMVPPAAVVTLPLKGIVASMALAWNLLDYPLTLRGVRVRHRFDVLARHPGACLGFGAIGSLLFWVPCLGVLMLPVGVAASTSLVWTLLRADPGLLPDLPRPRPPAEQG